MNAYLLDVNTLLALSDPRHLHHGSVHRWFAGGGHKAWATCPITENGFVRIASHPSYPNRPGDVATVAGILSRLRQEPGHQFWPDDVSLLDSVDFASLIAPGQITDLYLLGLAAHHGGRLATLDGRIMATPVPGGRQALTLIPT